MPTQRSMSKPPIIGPPVIILTLWLTSILPSYAQPGPRANNPTPTYPNSKAVILASPAQAPGRFGNAAPAAAAYKCIDTCGFGFPTTTSSTPICTNGAQCTFWTDGHGYCVAVGQALCCQRGLSGPRSCPSEDTCVAPWGLGDLKCQKSGSHACPTKDTFCLDGQWCCGNSCGSSGDSCCRNSATSMEYKCGKGFKCGNNACAPVPTLTPNSGAWTAQGCYTDSTGARGLPNSYVGSDVKIGVCASKAAGFKYFGVEFSNECYWGNNLASTSTKTADSACDRGCAGFPAALCGGSGTMNVYLNGEYHPPAPTVVPNSGNFKSIGCYADSAAKRALGTGSLIDYGTMTVAKCIQSAGKSFKYAGVEFHGECYWSNTLSTNKIADSSCNTACAGDGTQLCGGGNAINVYQNSAYIPPTPNVVPSVGNFNSIGCYSDSSTSRALKGGSYTDANGMTVFQCIAKAGTAYKYAAVEFGVECYWGNTLSSNKISDRSCNMACSGDDTQLCGGGNALNTYQNSAYTPPPTLTRTQVLALIQRFQDIMKTLHDDIVKWQNAIAGGRTGRSAVKARADPQTFLMTVQTDYRVGTLYLRGSNGVTPESQLQQARAASIITVDEVNYFEDSVSNFESQGLVAVTTAVSTDAPLAAIALGVSVTILGGLATLATALSSGGGTTQPQSTTPTPTSTTTTTTTTTTTSESPSCTLCDCILRGYTPFPALPDDSSLAITDEDMPLAPVTLTNLPLPSEPDDITAATSPIVGPTRRLWEHDLRSPYYGAALERETNETSPRSNMIKRYESCNLAYVNDRYPSTARFANSANPPADAADNVAAITKWVDMQINPSALGGLPYLCTWSLARFPARQGAQEYATEHVYERHFLSAYLDWLMYNPNGNGPVATCDTIVDVFGTLSTAPGSAFAGATPLDRMNDALPCYLSGCTDNTRVSELFILNSDINSMKTIVLSHSQGLTTLPDLGGPWMDIWHKARWAHLVFSYMRKASVHQAFLDAHQRVRAVIAQIDQDPAYANHHPLAQTNRPASATWADTYDLWMSKFLRLKQQKMQTWMGDAVERMGELIDSDASLTQQQRIDMDNFLTQLSDTTPGSIGPFTVNAMQWGSRYAALMVFV